ncbi:MAG TPA: hypothetical protein VF600_16100 [Abditibacteriaceae bacterium]|jgi:hypothetical protein
MPRESQPNNLPVRSEDDAHNESSRELQRANSSSTHTASVNRNPFNAILSGTRWRRAARWIGLLIFVIGAGLLAYVFVQALAGFARLSNPGELQREINAIPGGATQSITAYISVLGGEALRFLYLLLLGVLGSMIASRGIQFFMASESVIDEAVVGNMDEDV